MTFKINSGILTISDKASQGLREDKSGEMAAAILEDNGFNVQVKQIVPDDHNKIVDTLVKWVDAQQISLIITSGGTGLSPRDITPQAMGKIIDYEVPGIAEAMRSASLKITPHAMISRAMAGVRKSSLIINLPGSPQGVKDNLSVVIPALNHAISKLSGDPTDCAA